MIFVYLFVCLFVFVCSLFEASHDTPREIFWKYFKDFGIVCTCPRPRGLWLCLIPSLVLSDSRKLSVVVRSIARCYLQVGDRSNCLKSSKIFISRKGDGHMTQFFFCLVRIPETMVLLVKCHIQWLEVGLMEGQNALKDVLREAQKRRLETYSPRRGYLQFPGGSGQPQRLPSRCSCLAWTPTQSIWNGA